MNKLIVAFEKAPTTRNAEKLVRYIAAHPMSRLLMTREDADVYKLALSLLGK